ncbi:MAG: histidine phosphatase family protein [Phaeodactylibacter sp.]|nr:histidine phosphatase family protein [Phaeodactylibacter sp.]MCB9263755.1 histidine phosphatase family protein [Lewinellaceae bacterium]MCB9286837.1 histidine phosphatase family protein [Lewinellaceae bacterium]
MKTVFFVRHAKSSWDDPSLRDIERPLNKRGKRDAPFMGKLLSGKGVRPDQLISSPAKRALTTARLFADALGISKKDIFVDKRIYDAYPDDILDILQELPDDCSTVLIFGHNPTFTGVANLFTEDYISNVPTCGVFRVDAEIDTWPDFREGRGRLTEYHYPKQYFD